MKMGVCMFASLPLRRAKFLPSSCFHTAIVWSSDELTNLRLSIAFTYTQDNRYQDH